MIKKNLFGFIAFAGVASLGLGLMTSGCGNNGGGSVTPAALVGGSNNVIFYYTLAGTEARTTLPGVITKVRYDFEDAKGKTVKVSKEYELKHAAEDTDKNISVPNVPTTAKRVNVAYYDEFGEVLAVGKDNLSWDVDAGQAIVAFPSIEVINHPEAVLKVSDNVLAPGDKTDLELNVTTVNGHTVDLIAFADVSGLDEYSDVLTSSDKTSSNYQAVGFDGTNKGLIPANKIKAVLPVYGGSVSETLDEPIYVTDQTVASIKLTPAAILPCGGATEKLEITVDEGDVPSSKVLIMNDDEGVFNSLGYKAVTVSGGDKVEVDAINEQPIQVIATYTNTGSGPVPEDVDVTDNTDFTLSEEIATVDKGIENIFSFNGSNGDQSVTVEASYQEGGTTYTDSFTFYGYDASSSVGFMNTDSIGNEFVTSIADTDVPSEGYKLDVVGLITYSDNGTDMVSDGLVIPDSIMTTYPEGAVSSPTQAGAVELNHSTDNHYLLRIIEPLTDNWTLGLATSTYKQLGLPEFVKAELTTAAE